MNRFLIVILAAGVAAAQSSGPKDAQALAKTGQGPAASSQHMELSSANGPLRPTTSPNAPVITVHGLCDSTGKANREKANCTTVLTRREFERFIAAMTATTSRRIDPSAYRNLAEMYTTLLVNADAGQRAGLDTDPRFAALLETTRLRALSGMYQVQELKHVLQVADSEIQGYYSKNRDSYEEVDLDRFMLPKNNPANFSDEAFSAKAKRLAEELHARAVKGEDIGKLEAEGLHALGESTLPVIAVGVRRGQLEEKADREVFTLTPGGVTSLLDERGLWMFYKRTGRQMLSLDTVSGEIKSKLFRDKIDALEKELHDETYVEYNDDYFGPDPRSRKQSAPTEPERAFRQKIVAPNDAVLTIRGACSSNATADAKSCAVRLSRQQFEMMYRLALTTPGKGLPPSPRVVAKDYVDAMIYGKAGERAGLDHDARFGDILRLARQRALADMYRVHLEEQANEISSAEIERRYKQNLRHFDEVKLSHVSVVKQDGSGKSDSQKARQIASELHERAARGADMDKLQHEASEELGVKNAPPALLQPIRRGALEQQTEKEVYALAPGQVTTVKELPNAFVFYRLESRRTVPLSEATPEIRYVLYREKLEKLTRSATAWLRADYNEQYFKAIAVPDKLSATAALHAK